MATSRPFTHDSTGTSAEEWAGRPEWGSVPALALADVDGGPVRRLVVVAAHPDDETLGAGGLMALAHARGTEVVLVLATLGEHSHPRSPTLGAEQLARRRAAESAAALRRVAPLAVSVHVGLADGAVADGVDALVGALVEVVGDGRGVLLVSPWSLDGHPDHDAAGRAAQAAAHRTGARCVQYPVWSWHWRAAGTLPWPLVRRLPLDEASRDAKRAAVVEHQTQVQPLSAAAGDEVLLTPAMLRHFDAPYETFVEAAAHDPSFDDLHERLVDPWGVDTRWYEQRKRELVLAMLPGRRYRTGWEAGCSTGGLAVALAKRCDAVVATDLSAVALARAEQRRTAAGVDHLRFEQRELTRPWEPAAYDLVVASEVGYFLSPHDLERFRAVVEQCLAPDGVVVLCHWRHPVVGWPLDGAAVHAQFRASARWQTVARYADGDVEIVVLGQADAMPSPAG